MGRGESNSKSEYRISKQIRMIKNTKAPKGAGPIIRFRNLDFGIVSDFGFGYSNFRHGCHFPMTAAVTPDQSARYLRFRVTITAAVAHARVFNHGGRVNSAILRR